MLRTWDRQFLAEETPAATALTKTQLQQENTRLREELRRRQEQRDILEKPWASSPHRESTLTNAPASCAHSSSLIWGLGHDRVACQLFYF